MDALILAGAMPLALPGVASALGTPVLGRPAGHFLMETLLALGITRVAIFGGAALAETDRLIGDGDRWGIHLLVAAAPAAAQAATLTALIAQLQGDELLVIHDDALLPPDAVRPLLATNGPGRLTGPTRPYGWLRLRRSDLDALGAPANLRRRLPALPLPACATTHDHPPLDQTHLLAVCRELALEGWHARTLLLREIDRGVRVGPGVVVGSGVRLVGPCVIAAGATLGDNVVIGPDAYVGARALICAGATVERAVVGDETALAPGAKLTGVGAFGPVRLPLTPDAPAGDQVSISLWEASGGPGLRSAFLGIVMMAIGAPFAVFAALLALAVPGPWLVRRDLVWFDGPGLSGRRALTLRWWRLPTRGPLGFLAWPLRFFGVGHWPSLPAVITRQLGWQGARPGGEAAWRRLSSQDRGVLQHLGPGLIDAHRVLLGQGRRPAAADIHQFLVTLSRGARRSWTLARCLGRRLP